MIKWIFLRLVVREEKEKVVVSMVVVREGLKNFSMFYVFYVGVLYSLLMFIVLFFFDL